MYSDRLRELFHSRTHAGKLEDATHYGEAGIPGQGPYIQIWLRVAEGQVEATRFKTYGCPAAISCAEAVAAWSEGQPLAALSGITARDVIDWVGGVPEGKEHCSELAALCLISTRAK